MVVEKKKKCKQVLVGAEVGGRSRNLSESVKCRARGGGGLDGGLT